MCTHGFDSTMNDCIEAPVAPKSESVLEMVANWAPAASTFVPESEPFLIVITIILVTVIFAISGLSLEYVPLAHTTVGSFSPTLVSDVVLPDVGIEIGSPPVE